MGRSVTLLQLRTWCQQATDKENDEQVSTSEWNDWINKSAASTLRHLIIQLNGREYYDTNVPLTTVANNPLVDLPSDFLKVNGVWWERGANDHYELLPYPDNQERGPNRTVGWALAGWNLAAPIYYAVRVDTLRFVPTPQAAHTIRLHYTPDHVELRNDGDPIDCPAGFEKVIIWDVAAAKIAKQDGDPSFAMGERERAVREIVEMHERNHAHPTLMTKMRRKRAYYEGL